jgi:epsilon-lactone hydrolase
MRGSARETTNEIDREVSVTIPLSSEERERETALRARIARYWSTASGEPRAIFDSFISTTPFADGVSFERIENAEATGWWASPSAAEHDGVILYIHGGGFVQGSADAFRGIASQIASRTRRRVFALDYPLAPEATLPAALAAALAAYEWLKASGVSRIALVGDSAGGGLTLATLSLLAQRTDGMQPVAAVLFSPWVDLVFAGASMRDPRIDDALITYEHLHDYARKYLGHTDPRDPLASPLYGDLSRLPPLLIQVGTDERLLDDGRRLAERAARAGSHVRLEVWQGMHHVFQLNVADLRTSGIALDHAAEFLVDAIANR